MHTLRVTITSTSPTTHEPYTSDFYLSPDPDTGLCEVSQLDAGGVAVNHWSNLEWRRATGLLHQTIHYQYFEAALPTAPETWRDGHESGLHSGAPRVECALCR